MSTCISGMEIYGDNDQWYYTPTSRCRDSGCMDCEDFTSMPSRKHQCMPCSFRDNCSFMRVDCEYDDQYDGSRFGKTDSDRYFSGMNRDYYGNRNFYGNRDYYGNRNFYHNSMESFGSNSRASCIDRCQRRGDDQMDCQRRCESEESMSGRGRDVYHNRDFYGHRDYNGNRNFHGQRNFYGHRDYNGNRNFYGHRNFNGNSMNGEEYCESEFMLRNEESCKASSCCQWNTWEEGDASFNGQGRCWSDIGAKMCTDIFEGSRFGERDSYRFGSFMSAMGRRHTIMDTEESVGSSSNRCMDRCQRDGNDYMTCMNRCPRAEEGESDRDSSSDSSDSSDDDFRPSRDHHRRRNCREDQYWDGYRCVYFDEKSVGSSSSRYSCMDRCQRDGHDYMTCRMRCPSEESVSDRDSSSASGSSDDFHPSQDHRHNRRNCREDQYWNGERCVQARKYRKEEEGTYKSHRDHHSFGQPM